jgi:hypothetical protein
MSRSTPDCATEGTAVSQLQFKETTPTSLLLLTPVSYFSLLLDDDKNITAFYTAFLTHAYGKNLLNTNTQISLYPSAVLACVSS